MAQFPRPSKVNMAEPEVGFTAEQPEKHVNGTSEIRDGQSLLNAKQSGKMNENRSTSLRPRKK